MLADHLGKGEPGILATGPVLAIGNARLFRLRRVDAVEANALARDVDGVAVDDTCLASELAWNGFRGAGYLGTASRFPLRALGAETGIAQIPAYIRPRI